MIKGFYVNKDKTATIMNHVHTTASAEIYLARFRTIKDFILLLRTTLKDVDKNRTRYTIPYELLKDNHKLEEEIRKLGFKPEKDTFVSQYWYRAPANLGDVPYEIVSGRMNRDEVLIVNDSIDGGMKDDLYVVRNVYKEVLTYTDSRLEAERYMKS